MPKVISQKVLAANAVNAAQSTGPASPAAKARVAQNATRHGLRASALIIPGENENEFNELRDKLYEDFEPTSRFECACVDRMACAAWRMRRAPQYEAAAIRKSLNYNYSPPDEKFYFAPAQVTAQLERYETMLDRQYARAFQHLMDYRKLMAMRVVEVMQTTNTQDASLPGLPDSDETQNCANKAM